jgi:PKD repeat protein
MKRKLHLFVSSIILLCSTLLLNAQSYNYYYGNIHSQTSYSDGNPDSATSLITKPIQAFTYAKASQHIDFYGISDHNHVSAGMTSVAHYHQGIADAISATTSTFVAMYGFEWGVISGGGHVIVYGSDSLWGWDSGVYDLYVAQNDYTTLWKKVMARPSTFAYLCHPNTTDYGSILTTTVNINADSAIIGMAGRSGPAFSTNTTYSNPSTSTYITQYNDALKYGYHVGVGLDHDTHNSVYGRQTAGRTVVLASSLTKANIYDAFKKMRFYCSDDWNTKVNFQILNQPLGSIITHSGTPTLSITITDPDVAETVSSIVVYYGVPGSGTTCTALTTVTNTANLTYVHSAAANLSKYYYYLEITQADGDKIWTSPIWYNRNDAVVSLAPVASCSTPSTTICSGQSATFTDASTNTPTSWAWNAIGAIPSSSTLQNPTFTYTTAGTFSVTLVASNSAGSSAMITKTLTVKATPIVSVNSPSICNGASTTLTVSGATSYLWNGGATTTTISVAPTTTANYTVTGTTSGCSKAVISTVTVNPIPVLTVNSSTICSGKTATLTASGATTYSWNTGATSSSISLSPATSTNYTITGTSLGCSKTNTTSITVTPNPTITVSSPTTICAGTSVNLTASGATTYSWNTGATTNSISVSPASSTNYTITGTSSGCSKTNTTSVAVNPTPALTVNASTICAGASTNLTASGATTYSWNTGATTNSISVSPASSTNYTITGTSLGCSKTNTTSVTVNATPSSPTITSSGNTLTSSATTGNQWYLNGVLISGATNQTYTSTQNGNYTDVVTNTFNCSSSPSNTINVTTTGIDVISNANLFTIYPNPTSGLVAVDINIANQPASIELVNELGQTLYSTVIKDCKATCTVNLDLNLFSNGVYFVKVISGSTTKFQKIILNK